MPGPDVGGPLHRPFPPYGLRAPQLVPRPARPATRLAYISSTQIFFPLFSRRGSYLPLSVPSLVRHTFFGDVTCGTGLAKELWWHRAARHDDDTWQGEGGRLPTVPFLSCGRTASAAPHGPPPNGVSRSPSALPSQHQRRRLWLPQGAATATPFAHCTAHVDTVLVWHLGHRGRLPRPCATIRSPSCIHTTTYQMDGRRCASAPVAQ